MECSEVRLRLDEYIRNRLDSNIAQSISLHLENCRKCSCELSLLRELNDVLNEQEPVLPGTGFTQSVMDRIESERVCTRRFTFNRFPIINLGVSLVLTGLLIIFINIPSINGVINNCTNRMQYSAAAISSSVDTTTSHFQTYFKNIFNSGGE